MNSLLQNWPKRVLIILVVTGLLCLLMAGLASTEWAEGVRLAAAEAAVSSEPETPPSGPVIYLMSAFKALVLCGVPMLLAMGVLKLISRFSSN